MKNAIGKITAKTKAYCTVCQSQITRNISALVYENTPIGIEKAKSELRLKAEKSYTCRICASILKNS